MTTLRVWEEQIFHTVQANFPIWEKNEEEVQGRVRSDSAQVVSPFLQ